MAAASFQRLDRAVQALPRAFPGPGGAIAVLREGDVLVRRAWGWANAERRIAFTPRSAFRMCSITKQFTCAAILDAFPDPSVLDDDVRARLPRLIEAAPGALHLCHNQSGLRDYWAVAMLHGAPAESPFGDHEAARVIGATRGLQFRPGSSYSYANQNFRILSDILQTRTGQGFAERLSKRIFEPAGMESAFLGADTRALPDGTEGYEGSQATGFRAAENRILWTGDAGMAASLDDMIAWERHIDATRDDEDGLYRRLSAPVSFGDGAPAGYGFGLGRGKALGRAVSGHGGALRGWRSHRMYAPAERISIVVMFNHLSDAQEAALMLFAAALDEDPPARAADLPGPAWLGAYIEPRSGIAARIEAAPDSRVRLRFGQGPERLDLREDGGAGADLTRLRPGDGGLWMDRPQENHRALLRPIPGPSTADGANDSAGLYHCEELDAHLTVADMGGLLYGAFSGFLGAGRMELLDPIGADVWALPCPRALDHTPPGDWTLAFQRGEDGRISGVQVGCWLARGFSYARIA